MARLDYAALNDTIRYTMWSVFRVGRAGWGRAGRGRPAGRRVRRGARGQGGRRPRHLRPRRLARRRRLPHLVARRGRRGTAGRLRRPAPHDRAGRASAPVWSQVALHRPAEFNKSHVPAFLAGEEPSVTSASTCSSGPTTGTARRRRAAPDARPAWPAGPRVPRRAGQHRRELRARRLRVDPRVRGRRSCTASSTSCAPCERATLAGTSARRSRSSPGRASRSGTWSRRCRERARQHPAARAGGSVAADLHAGEHVIGWDTAAPGTRSCASGRRASAAARPP